MRKLVITAALLFYSICLFSQNKCFLYLSPKGDDNFDGKSKTANQKLNTGPFQTLDKIKAEIEKLSVSDIKDIEVVIMDGIYPIDHTFVLSKEILRNKDIRISFKSLKNEHPRFIGGKVVSGFKKVTDEIILARLNSEVRNKIMAADLKHLGIKEYGNPPQRFDLLFRGKFMQVSRYPDSGWLLISDVPQNGDSMYHKGDPKVILNGKWAGKHFGRIAYSDLRPDTWQNSNDIWMHGYWVWDWKDDFQKIDKIDHDKKEILPSKPFHWYGYEKGQRYYYFNILEELDKPGEWYFDKENEIIYFYPPEEIKENDVMLSILDKPMFQLKDVDNVKFENIIFECSKSRVVEITGGKNNLIAGCIIRNIGADTAVVIRSGTNNGVKSCDIYDIGATGIAINGGDKTSLTPGHNFASNNHITRFANKVRAFSAAIYIRGVGNTASHNKIHDAPFSGLQYYGNDHILEYNEIYDISHEAGDVGGMNTGGDWTDMGVIIRHNYFHHIHGPGNGQCRAVYLDLPGSNTTIYGNVFFDLDMGIFFNSGRDNKVENNIFVKCKPSVNNYNWPHKNYFYKGGAWKIWEKMMQYKYSEPPYSSRYPIIKSYYDSSLTKIGLPIHNVYRNNISFGGSFMDLSEDIPLDLITISNNLICDSVLLNLVKKWTIDIDPYAIPYTKVYTQNDKDMVALFEKLGNKVMSANPGFIDLKSGNLQLRKDSPAYKLGFKTIPIEKIGLYEDEYRKILVKD